MSDRRHQDGHDHDSHEHGHEHDHGDEIAPALQSLIYKQIDFENIRTLNESQPRAGANVIEKPWRQRLEPDPELTSDADEQLLIFVPFAGQLKLHSILIRTSESRSSPQNIRLFINRDDLDFNSVSSLTPTQSIIAAQTNDVQELPVKRAKFGNVYSLSLFVDDNYGDDMSKISWLGFKGEFLELKREAVEVLYEKAANPKDHKLVQGIGERGMLGSGSGRHGM